MTMQSFPSHASPMAVYLASRVGRQREMRQVRDRLHLTGRYKVISSWLDCVITMDDASTPPSLLQERAMQEREEVLACQLLIHFTESSNSPYGRGGRHVECGMAIGFGNKSVVLIGYRENIFSYLPQVLYFPTLDAFLATY